MSEFEGPLHSGLSRKSELSPTFLKFDAFEGKPAISCRCDQEAWQDANNIQHARKRALRAEKELKAQIALTRAALLLLPVTFFVSIVLAIVLGSFAHKIPISVGKVTIFAVCVFLALSKSLLAWKASQNIIRRLEKTEGRTLWEL